MFVLHIQHQDSMLCVCVHCAWPLYMLCVCVCVLRALAACDVVNPCSLALDVYCVCVFRALAVCDVVHPYSLAYDVYCVCVACTFSV